MISIYLSQLPQISTVADKFCVTLSCDRRGFAWLVDCTIYTNHFFIKTIPYKGYRTYYKIYNDVDTFGSDSVFLLIKFTREVKVVQPYFIVE